MFALSVTLAILMLSFSFGVAVNACRLLRLAPPTLPPTPSGRTRKEQLAMVIFGKTLPNTLGQASLVLLLILLILATGTRDAFAQARSTTGFVYPIGSATWNHAGGAWLERDAAHGGNYTDGMYHTGEDMLAPLGASVYAISSGDVVKIWTTYGNDVYGIGPGNSVIFIRHTLQNGSQFLACYMHVRPTIAEGDHVSAGQVIANVGPWYDVTHLHFGIHQSTVVPTTSWGRMANYQWPNTNGFVDPVAWLNSQTPAGGSVGTSAPTTVVSESDTAPYNGGPGFQRFGDARYWHDASEAGLGGHMYYTYNNDGYGDDNVGTWRPNLPVSGTYEVSAYIPWNHGTTTHAHYTVFAADGIHDIAVNQNALSNVWVSLGTYPLSSGTAGYVRLVDTTGETYNTKQIGFDSVKFDLRRANNTPPSVSFNESYKNRWLGPKDLNTQVVSWTTADAGGGNSGLSQAWDHDDDNNLGTSPQFPGSHGGYATFGYINGNPEGLHTLFVRVWSGDGSRSQDYASGQYGYDASAPTVNITSGQTAGTTYTSPQKLVHHIADPYSGVAQWGQAWDSDPGPQFSTSDGSLDLPVGTHTLHVHTWDKVGNNHDYTFGPFTYTPPAVAPSFIGIASASPASIAAGGATTIQATVTDTGGTGSCLVYMEVDDASGNIAGKSFWDNESFTAGSSKTYSFPWTAPGTPGTYTVKLACFRPGWGALLNWNNSAATVSVK